MFEELGRADTPAGPITLRRRRDPVLDQDVWEVKLGHEFLMSSVFTVAEVELARLGLAAVAGERDLDVVVGGLGLGFTATTVLDDPRVASLTVVEALGEVVRWHEERLLPESDRLVDDDRAQLLLGDFFAMVNSGAGFDSASPGRQFDAILVDIDHSPRHHLDGSHADFYTADGLRRLARHLADGGVFALWSDDAPDDEFRAIAREVFASVRAEVVTFRNRITGGESANTVYVMQ